VTKETQQASQEGRLSLLCRTGPLRALKHAATAVLDWTRALRLESYEHTNCPSTPLASVRSDAGGPPVWLLFVIRSDIRFLRECTVRASAKVCLDIFVQI
jgi:hypothetical protein